MNLTDLRSKKNTKNPKINVLFIFILITAFVICISRSITLRCRFEFDSSFSLSWESFPEASAAKVLNWERQRPWRTGVMRPLHRAFVSGRAAAFLAYLLFIERSGWTRQQAVAQVESSLVNKSVSRDLSAERLHYFSQWWRQWEWKTPPHLSSAFRGFSWQLLYAFWLRGRQGQDVGQGVAPAHCFLCGSSYVSTTQHSACK